MKLKKTVSAVLAGAMLLGTSAFAKDNIYAYNKFISTVIGPQVGYCDFAASFAGHENEYDEDSYSAQPVYLGLSLVCFCEVAT